MLTRREFLPSAIAAAAPAASLPRMNFLILHTDDQRFNTIRALGNTVVQTPNMDRLAARGVAFTQCTTQGGLTGAICAPSRAQLLSGASVFRVHPALVDKPEAPDAAMTVFPQRLRENGYATFHTGKWHLGPKLHSRCFTHGANIFFGGMSDHDKLPVFDFDAKGEYPAERRRLAQGFSSQVIADSAIDFLKQRKDEAQPFLLYTAFTSPHDPRMAPEKFARMYDAGSMALPPNFLPQHPFDNGELRVRDELLAAVPRTPDEIKRHLAAYYAMISEVDEQIGRLMDALEASPHGKNTVVVFAGDNGLAVGSHGLMGKQNLYEHSLRVPMVWAGPGIAAGKTDDSLCHLMDVAPTICRMAGVPMKAGPDGQDLFQGKRREATVAAYRGVQRALRTQEYKLILYNVKGEQTAQLFNVVEDPNELLNLAAFPQQQGRIKKMTARMKELLKAAGDDGAFFRA